MAKQPDCLDPDFYNDITRPIAMQLGNFKYTENDGCDGPTKGPIILESGAKYIGQFVNGLR